MTSSSRRQVGRAAILVVGLLATGGIIAAFPEAAAPASPAGRPTLVDGVDASGGPGGPGGAGVDGPSASALRTADQLLREAGPRAAGRYWDPAGRHLVVRIVGTAPRTLGDLRILPAEFSWSDLTAAREEWAARLCDDAADLYVDPRVGRVLVTPWPGHDGSARAAVRTDPRVQVRVAAAAPKPQHSGGTGLLAGSSTCTMGFTGTRSGVPVFVTAGHCGGVGTSFSSEGQEVGTLTHRVFPGMDYAVGTLTGGSTPGRVATGSGDFVPVRGSLEAPVGARVCTQGATSGWACGPILAKDVTVRYEEGGVVSYVHGLTKVGACTDGGDSGGPWLWGTQAQGLTSGGAGQHDGGCASAVGEQAAYVQPINPVLAATGVVLDVDRG